MADAYVGVFFFSLNPDGIQILVFRNDFLSLS